MKIIVSTSERPGTTDLLEYHPDLIEVRLDLLQGDVAGIVQEWFAATDVPLVLTLRSQQEGGLFSGTPEDWLKTVTPLLPCASYIDIEQRFASHARYIRSGGISIIASFHTKRMPSIQELDGIEHALREYGDIPKIVVTPSDEEDMITFFSFTLHAKKPVITSVMGDQFRYMRPILPLFGSDWVFGHAGCATAAGQYHIRDLREIYARLIDGDGTADHNR